MKRRILASRQTSRYQSEVFYPQTAATDPCANRKFSTDEVADLLRHIQQLKGLDVSARAEDNSIIFAIGDEEYQVPNTSASKIF